MERTQRATISLRRVECGSFDEQDRFCLGWSKNAKTADAFVSLDFDETRFRIRIDDEVIDALSSDLAHVYLTRKGTRIYFVFKDVPRFLVKSDTGSPSMRDEKFERVSAFDESHRRCAPYAVVYRVDVTEPGKVSAFVDLTKDHLPSKEQINEHIDAIQDYFDKDKMIGVLEKLEYRVAFQAEALVGPNKLMPKNIIDMQKTLRSVEKRLGSMKAAEMVRGLRRQVIVRGPHLRNRGKKAATMEALAKRLDESKPDNGDAKSVHQRRRDFSIHTVNLTPCTGTRLEGPNTDEGNRILRQYDGQEDNFLRVRITEEDSSALRLHNEARTIDTISLFNRVYVNAFSKAGGITVAGRRFYFLAYGNSGLREGVCWFVRKFIHNGKRISAEDIIGSIGDLSHIRTPALYAARLGQAFSSTSIVVPLHPSEVDYRNDIVTADRGYKFTDGIGKLSSQTLSLVMNEIAGRRSRGRISIDIHAFQMRLAGAKGMLALDTRLKGNKVVISRSMVKFDGFRMADDKLLLEVSNYWPRPKPFFLNHQAITLLESLGVPKGEFLRLQKNTLNDLERASQDPVVANKLHRTLNLGKAVKSQNILKQLGVRKINAVTEVPFLHDTNMSLINFALRRIKYGARIPIPHCHTLVGVIDETDSLLPDEIVACIAYPRQNPRYLTGKCLIGRSPMIAPGDLQFATAVMPTKDNMLSNLHNVVIFSSKGDRPLPSKLSGGDLDGDLYNIIQHPRVLGKVKRTFEANNYTAPEKPDIGRCCNSDDVADFFLNYSKMESVGIISSRHLQLADKSEHGSLDRLCMQLAKQHSIAVDYAKTGIPVDLRNLPKAPPKKPDFMQKEFEVERAHDKRLPKPRKQFYCSKKALGRMFRRINVPARTNEWSKASEHYGEEENEEGEAPWRVKVISQLEKDNRHQGWYEEMEPMQDEVKEYNAVMNIIAQDNCPDDRTGRLSEEEVFMGHVLYRGMRGTRMSMYELSKRLQEDFEELCCRTRERVLIYSPAMKREPGVYKPVRTWVVDHMNTYLKPRELDEQLNALAGTLQLERQTIKARWEKHLLYAVKRGFAFVSAAFRSDEGRSAAWIVIPCVFAAHHLLDCLGKIE